MALSEKGIKIQWGKTANIIMSHEPLRTKEELEKDYPKTEEGLSKMRAYVKSKGYDKTSVENEENIDEVINNLIEESNKATTDEDKLKYLAKIQKNYAIKKKILEIEEKKKELEEMEKGLEDLKGELNKCRMKNRKKRQKKKQKKNQKKRQRKKNNKMNKADICLSAFIFILSYIA